MIQIADGFTISSQKSINVAHFTIKMGVVSFFLSLPPAAQEVDSDVSRHFAVLRLRKPTWLISIRTGSQQALIWPDPPCQSEPALIFNPNASLHWCVDT